MFSGRIHKMVFDAAVPQLLYASRHDRAGVLGEKPAAHGLAEGPAPGVVVATAVVVRDAAEVGVVDGVGLAPSDSVGELDGDGVLDAVAEDDGEAVGAGVERGISQHMLMEIDPVTSLM